MFYQDLDSVVLSAFESCSHKIRAIQKLPPETQRLIIMPSRRKPTPKQKATVSKLANDTPKVAGAPHVARDVLDRIKKCFDRAKHTNANEAEARAAMRMASKMMLQHNITQSQIMEGEELAQREQRGGLSALKFTSSKVGGRAIFQTWVSDLISAVVAFFDCNAYTSQAISLEVTFYGIAEHTVSAAMAFEMVHNLILNWAEAYNTIAGRNSYCHGVASGLCALADMEKRDMEINARKNEHKAMAAKLREEELERQKAIAKLNGSAPPAGVTDVQSLIKDEVSEEPSNVAVSGVEAKALVAPSELPATSLDNEFDDAGERSSHSDPLFPDRVPNSSGNVPNPDNDLWFGESNVSHDDDSDGDYAHADYQEENRAQTIDLTGNFEADLHTIIRAEAEVIIKKENEKAASLSQSGNSTTAMQGDPNTEPTVKTEDDENLSPEWASLNQLTLFRENAKVIEEGVLKSKGIDLKKGQKRKRSVKDSEAYFQGKKDSKKVNIRVGTIEL